MVDEIEGEDMIRSIKLRDVKTGIKSVLNVTGIFISIGLKPNTDHLNGVLLLDSAGYIITNDKMETEMPGIFTAGDKRQDSARQEITAAGDGSTAAIYAQQSLP